MKVQAQVTIKLGDAPSLREVKTAAAHIEAATQRKPTVLLWGTFVAGDDLVFASPIKVIGYSRGKVKALVDGEITRVTIDLIERATIIVE